MKRTILVKLEVDDTIGDKAIVDHLMQGLPWPYSGTMQPLSPMIIQDRSISEANTIKKYAKEKKLSINYIGNTHADKISELELLAIFECNVWFIDHTYKAYGLANLNDFKVGDQYLGLLLNDLNDEGIID